MRLRHLAATALISAALPPALHAAPLGTPDPTFSGDGLASVDFGSPKQAQDTPFAQVAGPGGSVYLVGTATITADPDVHVLAIAKLQPDGTLDPKYGDGGRVLHALPGDLGTRGGAMVTPAGDLVVGTTYRADVPNAGPNDDVAIVCRFGKTGTLDTAFGDTGCLQTRPLWLDPQGTQPSEITSLTLRLDGTLLVGGWFATSGNGGAPAIAAILPDGSGFDAAFDGDGIAHFPATAQPIEGLKLNQGGAVMGASSIHTIDGTRGTLVRADADTGAPDDAFGIDGVLVLELPLTYPDARIAAFDVGGTGSAEAVYVVGTSKKNILGPRSYVARLTGKGALNAQFGNAGVLEFELDAPMGPDACAVDMVTGGIVIAGASNAPAVGGPETWFARKLDTTGAVDTAFGDAGETALPLRAHACHIAQQGRRLLLAGASDGNTGGIKPGRFHAARLDHGLTTAFQVKPSAGPNGTIAPAVPVMTTHSAIAEFKVVPKFGFRVASVSGCGNGERIGTRYRTGPITAACSVTATFEKIPVAP